MEVFLVLNVFRNLYHDLILTGSTDGKVHCWSTETGMRVVVLNGDHNSPVQCVQFNPKYMMLATACTNMVSDTACVTAFPSLKYQSYSYVNKYIIARNNISNTCILTGPLRHANGDGNPDTTATKKRLLFLIKVAIYFSNHQWLFTFVGFLVTTSR